MSERKELLMRKAAKLRRDILNHGMYRYEKGRGRIYVSCACHACQRDRRIIDTIRKELALLE